MDATILIVDDVAANRNLLSQALEPQGCELLLAPDGETALDLARQARFDPARRDDAGAERLRNMPAVEGE